MTRIFISYSSRDSTFADAYYEALSERGHEVWMDRAELKGGQEWVRIIQEKIRWADSMVVLWSASALASTWVEMEMTYAHTLRKKIIPVRIDDTSPQEHMIINARQVIDARGVEDSDVIARIEDSIGRPHNPRPITTRTLPVESAPTVPVATVAPAASAPPPKPARDHRLFIGGFAVLVVAVIMVLAAQALNPPIVTPTPGVTATTGPDNPATPLPTLPPGALDQAATLELLNDWRASSGLPLLAEHEALQAVAEQHASYLRSLPLPELESANIFRNAEGQDVVFMANEAGYGGDVIMIVDITDGEFTLQNLLDRVGDQARYIDAGIQQVRAIATGKLYFVLILGAGG
jgi:hypothetical protein